MVDEYEDDDVDQMEEGADGEQDMLDRLGESMGSLPWWILSISLHVVLGLMLALIGITQMGDGDDGVVIEMRIEEEMIPPYDPEIERDIVKNNVVNEEDDPVEVEIVEPVEEYAEPESDDEEDASDIKGKENAFTNVEAGGWGNVGFMGVGGGGLAGKFGNRVGGRRNTALKGGGSKRSESAVDAALAWLARHQEEDGHWDNVKYQGSNAKHDAAQTGLALLAFLGGGHTEKAGTFRNNVTRAVKWIMGTQQPNGAYSDAWGYNHAMCALAMAEASGMGNVAATKASAQKAVDYSVNIHQIGEGSNKGGWRYSAKPPAADISVSGWFIMQLKSANVAGLRVPFEGFEGATRFLDSVEVKEDANDPYSGHRYAYMADPDNASQLQPTGMRTAIGVLCRQFLGVPRDQLQGGVQFMLSKSGLPRWGAGGADVDWYYWYYGTLVTFQMGGDFFKQWNDAMRDMLCDHQIKGGDDDGSWDPTGRYAAEGRVLATAAGALCLEVYYRYSPLYRGN